MVKSKNSSKNPKPMQQANKIFEQNVKTGLDPALEGEKNSFDHGAVVLCSIYNHLMSVGQKQAANLVVLDKNLLRRVCSGEIPLEPLSDCVKVIQRVSSVKKGKDSSSCSCSLFFSPVKKTLITASIQKLVSDSDDSSSCSTTFSDDETTTSNKSLAPKLDDASSSSTSGENSSSDSISDSISDSNSDSSDSSDSSNSDSDDSSCSDTSNDSKKESSSATVTPAKTATAVPGILSTTGIKLNQNTPMALPEDASSLSESSSSGSDSSDSEAESEQIKEKATIKNRNSSQAIKNQAQKFNAMQRQENKAQPVLKKVALPVIPKKQGSLLTLQPKSTKKRTFQEMESSSNATKKQPIEENQKQGHKNVTEEKKLAINGMDHADISFTSNNNNKQPRRGKEYFRRVNPNEVSFANDKLRDNSFASKPGSRNSYGEKAAQDFSSARGKDFRQEKAKKKRGSYRGGSIDTSGVHSIKFTDD